MPESMIADMDDLVKSRGYVSRSGVIRTAVRNLIEKEKKGDN